MRKLALVTIAALAACSDAAENQMASSPAVVQLQPGQWEMTTEVTGMEMTQPGGPAIPAKAGPKVTTTNCVTEAQVKSPDANLFSGSKGACKYDNFYMSDGRLNAQMTCDQPGSDSSLMMSIDGKYTATTMDVTSELTTSVPGSGDMRISSKLSGKRIGECPAGTGTSTKS